MRNFQGIVSIWTQTSLLILYICIQICINAPFKFPSKPVLLKYDWFPSRQKPSIFQKGATSHETVQKIAHLFFSLEFADLKRWGKSKSLHK